MATQPVAVLLVEVAVAVEVDATAGGRADRLLAERAGQDRLPGGLRPTDAVIGIAAGRVAVVRAGLSAPAEAEGLAYRLRTDLADRSPTEAGPAIRLVAIGTATSRAGDTGHDLLRYAEHAIADALVLGDGRVVSFDDADRDLLA